jgi:hypothetical protein
MTIHESDLVEMPLVDQLALFESAVIVIGPRQVAPYLMYTAIGTGSSSSSINSCGTRPKFVELIPASSVYANSVHYQYSTVPWMECHMIMMNYQQPQPQEHSTTTTSSFSSFGLDLEIFQEAMSQMFTTLGPSEMKNTTILSDT